MNRRWGYLAGGGVLVLAALGAAGARINTTQSLPQGLYWTTRAPVEPGAAVLFCPPPRRLFDEAQARGYLGAGYCPGGYGYLMKRVVAVQGDTVTVAEDGVRVNGKPLVHSAPLKADAAGRPLPCSTRARYTLNATELWLMSDGSPTSFDSRYFGPIDRAQIQAVITPVMTW
jgi:conjugative transfer signal peptidase TraF